ncbi:MAG: hypothetical protein ABW217_21825 [Polyangiaceae bacterium]
MLGWVRVSTYLSVVAAASGFGLARAASAKVDEAVQRFGENLVRQLGPELVGQPQELLVNGQRVMCSSQVIDRPIAGTLEVLSRHCESVASPALAAVAALPESARAGILAGVESPARLTIERRETDDQALGQIACIAHPQDGASLERVLERLLAFVDSGDLSAIGDARYFLARKLEPERTQVISIWTEGRFDLGGMFPGEGDAPGADSLVVPRPLEARRTFSALIPERPYAVRMYESRQSHEAILQHYDELMTAEGWLERPTSEGDELRELTRAFSRGDTVAFVILDASEQGLTPVTLLEMGGQGFVHAAVVEEPRP